MLRVHHVLSKPSRRLLIPASKSLSSIFTANRVKFTIIRPSTLNTIRRFTTSTESNIYAQQTTIKEKISFGSERSEKSNKMIQYWLLTVTGMVVLIVLVGGLTRLEEGGLSMVDWKFFGEIPPLNEKEWEEYFDLYKQFPEYQKKNVGMTLDEFKYIFWFEYIHRMLGRLVGVTFTVPAIYFAYKRKFDPKTARRVAVIGSLIVLQGLLGWYMVKSGLDKDHYLMKTYNTVPRVSQYRLAAHLGMAFAIYGVSAWTLMDLMPKKEAVNQLSNEGLMKLAKIRKMMPWVAAIIGITIMSGAFVAGTDAGKIYNTFPKMGNRWIPGDIDAITPKWKNIFENPTTIQFNHRCLAIFTTLLCATVAIYGRRTPNLTPGLKLAFNSLFAAAGVQFSLGLLTLLNVTPTSLAAAHQLGATGLWAVALWVLHTLKRLPK